VKFFVNSENPRSKPMSEILDAKMVSIIRADFRERHRAVVELCDSHEALRAENAKLKTMADLGQFLFDSVEALKDVPRDMSKDETLNAYIDGWRKLRAETEALRARLAALEKEREGLLRDGLVAIAGAVCTPEKGYAEDGGIALLLRDIAQLRKQHDELKRDAERWKWVFNHQCKAATWLSDLASSPSCDQGFAEWVDRQRKETT
jgi:hypothetical protein